MEHTPENRFKLSYKNPSYNVRIWPHKHCECEIQAKKKWNLESLCWGWRQGTM